MAVFDRRTLARKALIHDYSIDSGKQDYYYSKPSKQTNGNAPRIGTLLIALVVFAVLIKYLPEWKTHINQGTAIVLFNDISDHVITHAKLSSSWVQKNYGLLSGPLLCGILVTLFMWAIVYLDSDKPGVNPPSPFSPAKQQRYLHYRDKTYHLNYLVSVASGVVVCLLLFFSREQQ